MRVLVSAASRHGATGEIAIAIADELHGAGLDTVVRPPEEITSLEGFDAVVLGSGVYAGHWLQPAKDLIERQAGALGDRPVWLFSSGPAGDPPKPEGDPADVAALKATTHARDHRVFPGLIDRSRMGLAEKALLSAMRVRPGDYRPWADIRAWAAGIALSLQKA